MTHPNRPQFSDDKAPPAPGAEPTPEKSTSLEALDIAARELSRQVHAADAPPPAPTQKEATAIADVLFDPTLKRMVILVNNLINSTSSGDFAVFLPLATIQAAIEQIDFANSPAAARARAYLLAHHALTIAAENYREAVTAIRSGDKEARVRYWNQADTIRCYELLEKELPSGILDEPEPGLIAALLMDVGIPGTYEELETLIAGLTKEQQKTASDWAMGVATKGEHGVVSERPDFLPAPEAK